MSDVNINIDNEPSNFSYEIEGSDDTDILNKIGEEIRLYRDEVRELNRAFFDASQKKIFQK